MAKISAVALNNTLRNDWMVKIADLIIGEFPDDPEEVLQVASGKLAIPAVDAEGNDKWVVITVSIPKGSRDGDEFDGYAEAESFKIEQQEKADKAEQREKEKARKTAEREAKRAEKELAKKQKEEADS